MRARARTHTQIESVDLYKEKSKTQTITKDYALSRTKTN